MILRLSQKLNTKLKAGKLTDMPLDENPYADRSRHLFTADRTQYILLSHAASLYSYEVDPRDVGFGLNDLLLSAIASEEDRGYGRPKEAFQRLLVENE
ncbi:MAG: hypothetical protein J5I93_09505 [Pirellulaceae bacterium]|nr:hypothetical protein [Pirellulaceae bacterium]